MSWTRRSRRTFTLVVGCLVVSTLGPAAGIATATQSVPPTETATPTETAVETVIVRTEPGVDPAAAAAAAATVTGGTVSGVLDHALQGYLLTLPTGRLHQLGDLPGVADVDPDVPLQLAATPWNLDRVDEESLPLDGRYRFGGGGAGVTVYVVDSGVRISHHQFGGRAVNGYDLVDDDAVAQDCYGHGTHVAGIAAGSTYGVAPRARVVAVRVFDCQGVSSVATLVLALEWVLTNHPAGTPAVVNLSITGPTSAPLDEAVQQVVAAGIPVAVAAGNQGRDACTFSPGRVPAAITVGASDRRDRRAVFGQSTGSNVGSCIDLFAPGADITSAAIATDTATRVESGTSMAAPMVSGAIARYLEMRPSASPAEVRNWLTTMALTPVGDARSTCEGLLHVPAGSPPLPRPGPTVLAVTAGIGCRPQASNAGGEVLVLDGVDLDGATAVSIADRPAPFSVVDGRLHVTVPEVPMFGRARIRVTTPLGTSPPADAGWVELTFRDILPGTTFGPEVLELARSGAVRGYLDGTYRPQGILDRGSFAVILHRSLSPDLADPGCDGGRRVFRDVGAASSQCGAIEWAARQGYLRGYSDGTFRPRAALERGAAMTVLFRVAYPGRPDPTCVGAARVFPDVPARNPLCGPIETMVDAQVEQGYGDGTFRPDAEVTRAAAAAYLSRTLSLRSE